MDVLHERPAKERSHSKLVFHSIVVKIDIILAHAYTLLLNLIFLLKAIFTFAFFLQKNKI